MGAFALEQYTTNYDTVKVAEIHKPLSVLIIHHDGNIIWKLLLDHIELLIEILLHLSTGNLR